MSDIDHTEALMRTGYWGRQAAGVVFLSASTGRIGLSLRSADVLQPHTYGAVGGAIDSEEDPRVAVAREVSEEIGIALNPLMLRPLDVFQDGTFRYTTFLALVPSEFVPPMLNWESDSFDWFALNALPRNLHPGLVSTLSKPAVQKTLRRGIGVGQTLGRGLGSLLRRR